MLMSTNSGEEDYGGSKALMEYTAPIKRGYIDTFDTAS